jgi:chaperonin GroEL (HSP60 family)
MSSKDVKFGQDAREKMLRGVDILATLSRSRWVPRAATS